MIATFPHDRAPMPKRVDDARLTAMSARVEDRGLPLRSARITSNHMMARSGLRRFEARTDGSIASVAISASTTLFRRLTCRSRFSGHCLRPSAQNRYTVICVCPCDDLRFSHLQPLERCRGSASLLGVPCRREVEIDRVSKLVEAGTDRSIRANLHVISSTASSSIAGDATASAAAFDLRRVLLNPTVDRGVINGHTALGHHLLEVAIADPLRQHQRTAQRLISPSK